jgi:hypothetical protein
MDLGVTLATIFVGLATVAAAWAAWKATTSAESVLELAARQTRAAEHQEVTARQDLEASKHPLIVGIPRDPFDPNAPRDPRQRVVVDTETSESAITLTVPVRNIGRGPAFLISAKIAPFDIEQGQMRGDGFDAIPATQVLPSGEQTLIAGTVKLGEPAYTDMYIGIRTQFQVFVRYTDREAKQHQETMFDITPEIDRSGYAVARTSVNTYDEAWRIVGKQASAGWLPVADKKPTAMEALDDLDTSLHQLAEINRLETEELKHRNSRPTTLSPGTLRLAELKQNLAVQRAAAQSPHKDGPDTSDVDPRVGPSDEAPPGGRRNRPAPGDAPSADG